MNIEQLSRGNSLVVNINASKKIVETLQLLINTFNTKPVYISRNEHCVLLDKSVARVALILQLECEKETLHQLEQELEAL